MRVLVAGGGTGGHVFPGMAIAEEVVTRHPANDAVFVGTSRGLEARVVPAAGYPIELIQVRGLKGKGPLGFLAGLLLLPRALARCFAILRRWEPDVVVGVGGYASGPLVLAAWILRIPTALQEQNAMPGVTNRILGLFVQAAFTAFPEAGRFFAKRKVHQLGNPIRKRAHEQLHAPLAGPRPASTAGVRRLAGRARAQHAPRRGAAASSPTCATSWRSSTRPARATARWWSRATVRWASSPTCASSSPT